MSQGIKELIKKSEELAETASEKYQQSAFQTLMGFYLGKGKYSDMNTPVIGETKNSKIANEDISELDKIHIDEEEFSISEVVNKIRESDKIDIIESKILDKSNQLNRILLCFYFINKVYPNKSVTTGAIETLTDQLRVKIDKGNVSKKIKKEQKYFASNEVRKKGIHVHYKINRNGIKKFESIINK